MEIPVPTDDTVLPCSKCGGVFPLDQFYTAAGCPGRYNKHSWCKDCVTDDIRTKRANRTDEEKLADAKRTAVYSQRKKFRKYGLTEESFQRMLEDQGGVCAVCGLAETAMKPHKYDPTPELSIDHCHMTGLVRGLLCIRCNVGMGALGDTVAGLKNALAYLQAFEDRVVSDG